MEVSDIRAQFVSLYTTGTYVEDKSGSRLLEIVNASFVANENSIFGKLDHDYIQRELTWYQLQSRNVYDIQGKVPDIWTRICAKNGKINSNYGWCVFSSENHSQYQECLLTLLEERLTRRAIMIYTRPSMQFDAFDDGMDDFMCTNTVQYLIRNGKLHAIVNMRSNDAWAGYRNDFAWQRHVQDRLVEDYNTHFAEIDQIEAGPIHWNVGSLHLYSRQFYLVDHYMKTGDHLISKTVYDMYQTRYITTS